MKGFFKKTARRLSKKKKGTPDTTAQPKQSPSGTQTTSSGIGGPEAKIVSSGQNGTIDDRYPRKNRFPIFYIVRRLFGKREHQAIQTNGSSHANPLSTTIPNQNISGTRDEPLSQETTASIDLDKSADSSHEYNTQEPPRFNRQRSAPSHQHGFSIASTTSSTSEESFHIASSISLSPRPITQIKQEPSAPLISEDGDDDDVIHQEDLSEIFSGAPLFGVQSKSSTYGEPSVSYYEKSTMQMTPAQEHRDHLHVATEAFKGCTSRGNDQETSKIWTELLKGIHENPSMLSFFGIEPGTTGWQYYLETQVLDYEIMQAYEDGKAYYSLDPQTPDAVGVRSIDSSTMIDRLREINVSASQTGHFDGDIDAESLVLYGKLFTKILYPSQSTSAQLSPQEYSLENQCRVLANVLSARHVWIDFSRAEERIRLGNVLFGSGEEKLLLILQILLSCELWLRLKLWSTHSSDNFSNTHLNLTQKVKWDLIVSDRWLQDVKIVERPYTPEFDMVTPLPPSLQQPSQWSKYFGASVEVYIEDAEDVQEVDKYDAYFVPQNLERQLDGLLFFARSIGWPGIEMLEGIIRDRLRNPTAAAQTPSIYLEYFTPMSTFTPSNLTPGQTSINGGRTSYFGKHISSNLVRKANQGGWLSRTYTSGLILPGEGISHLLMGCLLENDSLALEEVGDQGNLYGGFVRRTLSSPSATASWWSSNNVIGKVLASESESPGCCGWVGKCVGNYTPRSKDDHDTTDPESPGLSDSLDPAYSEKGSLKLAQPTGWIDIITDTRPGPAIQVPRLGDFAKIEKESHPLGSEHSTSQTVNGKDFHFPRDLGGQTFQAEPVGLKFWHSEGYLQLPQDHTAPNTQAYRVEVMFRTTNIDKKLLASFDSHNGDDVGVVLKHDVSFITSFPCFRRPYSRPRNFSLPSPSSISNYGASIQKIGHPTSHRHPLHNSFQYDIISLTDLPFHSTHSRPNAQNRTHFISVINAAGGSPGAVVSADGRFVYAKAWCARWGADAIVARSNRTCLSCAIREAFALAVDVVIWLG